VVIAQQVEELRDYSGIAEQTLTGSAEAKSAAAGAGLVPLFLAGAKTGEDAHFPRMPGLCKLRAKS